MKSINYFLVLIIFVITSCKEEEKANHEFREEVLSRININEDTLIIFNRVLDQLDENNVVFGSFIKYHFYELEDSCLLAHKEIIDSFKENNLYKEHSDFMISILIEVHDYHLSSLGINKNDLNIIMDKMNMDGYLIKKYLNKNHDMQMYIPDDEK